MLNNNPAYVAYHEVGQALGLYIFEVKARFRVSRRINRLSALMNFLHTNIELTPKNKLPRHLTVERHGNLVEVVLREAQTSRVLDSWVFRCGKNKEDISDERETYFMSKDLCKGHNYGDPGETAKFKSNFAIFNHANPLHKCKGKPAYIINRSVWLSMTTMTVCGYGSVKSYCLS